MVLGATPEQKQTFLLDDIESYKFLNHGELEVLKVKDGHNFFETLKSMKVMGFTEDEILCKLLNSLKIYFVLAILRIASAVLLFGNIQFTKEKTSDQACLPNDSVAQKICYLLGLHVQEFTKAFLRPRIKVGRETVSKSQNVEQAEFAVEAISKACYERLFRWLVYRLNKSLDRVRRQKTLFVGILDIAG